MATLRRSVRPFAFLVAAVLAACSSPMHPGDGAADGAHDGIGVEGGDASLVDANDGAPTDMGSGDALDAPSDGGDGGDACADGSMCGANCADLQTDPVHCGSCGHDCTHLPGVNAADVRCVAGACSVTGACQPGRAHCSSNADDGCEVDTTTPMNCGGCGVSCSEPTPSCSADSSGIYHCASGCGGTTPTRCGAMCVDTQTNPQYCGDCSTACPTLTNGHATCTSGTCGVACDSGFHMCNAMCVADSDPNACGASCSVCSAPVNAMATCTSGSCGFDCSPGFADCDHIALNGCEVDTRANPMACGACGTVCTVANGTAGCAAGLCTVASCDAGFADCNGNAADGCEVATSNSLANCGACGTTCATPNGTPACVAGACTVMACNTGFGDCNNVAADGCEVNINTSASNCGSCGSVCNVMGGTSVCTMGVCGVSTCAMGLGDCNGMASDGCETNLETSVANCGACATPCALPHATPVCTSGACAVGSCDAGFADCDGIPTNGCEVNTTTTPTDCGGCGMICTTTNGSAGCAAGMCTVAGCNAGFADCDRLVPNGCETNTRTSVTDCGACGAACTTANGVPSCATGVCAISSCNSGFADCNGSASDGCEVDLGSSPTHCGGCANVCAVPNATAGCSSGACTIASCNTGFRDCNGNATDGCEVDINSNSLSCGACGNICFIPNGAAACIAGTCAIAACAPGYADCDGLPGNGCEANLATDPANCSSCGTACSSPNAAPACRSGVCGVGTCNSGFADCDNQPANGCEVNTRTSTSNCGSCGNACFAANASSTCVAGSCAIASCDTNFADCDSSAANGCESNLQSSVSSCGTCGHACTAANGFGGCASGTCTIASCSPGFADCNRMIPDGCEVNTNTDAMNCGTCGAACVVPNATPACAGGVCAIGSCNTGFADCDGNAANGCETNLNTSTGNCGTCGNICTAGGGTPVCTNGVCGISSCAAGRGDCNMMPGDGCETNTTNSVANCGACGNVCSTPNGTPGCASSTCVVASCNPGFANCNSAAGDGCETNLNTNVNSCGSCGRVCITPNANPTCLGGTCAIASCNPGFSNCNSTVADGCEINTQTDPNNCGGCGIRCSFSNGTAACSAGVCVIATCNPGFTNCDGNTSNGCETPTSTDPNNCGACGRVCSIANGIAGCAGGTCTVAACNAGFTNCDGNPTNGCEIHTSVDPNHCGSCANTCFVAHGTPGCSGGSCVVASCNAGYGNCNGSPADGCEANLLADTSNCGTCGNSCNATCLVGSPGTAASSCNSGSCAVTACAANYFDIDGRCSTGCECLSNGFGGTCSAPRALGTITLGNTATFTGNLVPTGAEAYFQVSFAGNTSGSYHPRIRFTSNPNVEFRFDVQTNCSGGLFSCGTEGGASFGRTDWETYFSGFDSGRFTNPIPAVTAIIHVYRRSGVATTCNNFTLQISN